MIGVALCCSFERACMAGEVVFNGLDAKVAPDIIFGVDDESFQPLANSSEFSPGSFLRDWTVTEPNSLLKLILVTRYDFFLHVMGIKHIQEPICLYLLCVCEIACLWGS